MSHPPEFTELAARVRNWGRWGDDDQRGTLNLITPDVVRSAAACVRRGVAIPLALPLSEDGPQMGLIPGGENPTRTMIAVNDPMFDGDPDEVATSDDAVAMGLQAATHWDSLAHVSHSGVLWNGRDADTVDAAGASWGGIDAVGPLVTRGVLLDVAAARGVDRLDGGHGITAADLDRSVEHAGCEVRPGDAVLVRTGQVQHLHASDRMAYAFPSPGLTMACAAWFHDRDVACVATDTLSLEVFPWEIEGLVLPVHLLHLVEMGMLQGQNWDLEALATDCANDGVHEFLLSATPEPFVRGLGAPVAPVAVK